MSDSAEVYPGMSRSVRPRLEVFAPAVEQATDAVEIGIRPAWRVWARRLHLLPIVVVLLGAALAGQYGCAVVKGAPATAARISGGK